MIRTKSRLNRRTLLSAVVMLPVFTGAALSISRPARADDLPERGDPLPSWNEGATKQAIVDFVRATTDQAGPNFVPPPERFALLQEYTVVEGDRLDNIAAKYVGDPERFWQVCDANAAMRPEELTEMVGRILRITLPEGIAG